MVMLQVRYLNTIKGPDNPTSQLLPIMSNKCCSGDGEGRKDKGGVEDREVKQVVCEELCVTKLHVKDGVLQRKGPFARSK